MYKFKFSIITVTYNCEDVIEKTIQSVLNQRYKDFEYIIIDGKSTDKTLSIINKYINNIDIILSEPDNGIYDAMNKGLNLANGKFINFLNAGDKYCTTDILSSIVKEVNKNIKVISGDFNLINAKTGLNKKIKTKKLNIENLKRDFRACHQSIFINKEISDYYNLSFKIRADYLWVINAIFKVSENQIMKLDFSIVDYSQEGSSFNSFWRSLKELIQIQKKMFNYQILLNMDVYLLKIIRNFKNEITSKKACK